MGAVTASAGPSRKALWLLVLGVLVAHLFMLLGAPSSLTVHLQPQRPADAVHIRMLAPPAPLPQAPQRPLGRARPSPAASPSPVPQEVPIPAQAASEPVTEVWAQVENAPAAQPPAPSPAETQVLPPAVQDVQAQTAWPLVPLGAVPTSRVLHYQLTGMDKGLTYHASGELRWQHNSTRYELALSVRAFLLGRRQWLSVGQIEAAGLAPLRFSDSWRNERAAHFDRAQQRVVFSSNSTPALLESGAQDQISLYVQLAAAMAGEPERFIPGTRLQVQTVTVRDAQPWSLVLEGGESMVIEGQSLKVLKWVCQPRNRFEARVEFWVAPEQAWLPLRIRISQVSGSYIDLLWRSSEPLPALPAGTDTPTVTKGS